VNRTKKLLAFTDLGNGEVGAMKAVLLCLVVVLVLPTANAQVATFGGTFFQPTAGFVNDAEMRLAGALTITIDLLG